jgi:hypothetical protein
MTVSMMMTVTEMVTMMMTWIMMVTMTVIMTETTRMTTKATVVALEQHHRRRLVIRVQVVGWMARPCIWPTALAPVATALPVCAEGLQARYQWRSATTEVVWEA